MRQNISKKYSFKGSFAFQAAYNERRQYSFITGGNSHVMIKNLILTFKPLKHFNANIFQLIIIRNQLIIKSGLNKSGKYQLISKINTIQISKQTLSR